ncbi:hypothetical protein QBC41DRAFT_396407 [Cercophora samala]|uniref:Uncharacterized protein n=1 Tax=Cercophora samala TaxID=330535 RepID=A0AA40D9U2_9PEZI|nr:hypothetical protein QBC41DRAFT_396407 [Cercophora samala]
MVEKEGERGWGKRVADDATLSERLRQRGRASTEGELTKGFRKARKEQVSTGSGYTLVWTTYDMSITERGFRDFDKLAKAGWEGDGQDKPEEEEEYFWEFDDNDRIWKRIKERNQRGFSPSDDEGSGGALMKRRLRAGSLGGDVGFFDAPVQKRLAGREMKLGDVLGGEGGKEGVEEPATCLMSLYDRKGKREEYFDKVEEEHKLERPMFFGDLKSLEGWELGRMDDDDEEVDVDVEMSQSFEDMLERLGIDKEELESRGRWTDEGLWC